MSQPKAKRNKQYRPKHVHIPVTGLRDEFGLVLHSALNAATLGYFSKQQYDRIGSALNCLYGALDLRPPKDPAVLTVIEGAMRTMNNVGQRGDETGVWLIRPIEQAAVLAGIRKAEEYLPMMDVMTLYDSMQKLKAMQIEEERTGKNLIFKSRSVGMTTAINNFNIAYDPAGGDDRAVIAEFKNGQLVKVTQLERTTS